jgi:hypothetical protein
MSPHPAAAGSKARAVDPIFVAIEAHRAAWREWEAKGVRGLSEGATRKEIAACKRLSAKCDRLCVALTRTEPTTMAGVVAALRHAVDHDTVIDGVGLLPDCHADVFFGSLMRGVRKMARTRRRKRKPA